MGFATLQPHISKWRKKRFVEKKPLLRSCCWSIPSVCSFPSPRDVVVVALKASPTIQGERERKKRYQFIHYLSTPAAHAHDRRKSKRGN